MDGYSNIIDCMKGKKNTETTGEPKFKLKGTSATEGGKGDLKSKDTSLAGSSGNLPG